MVSSAATAAALPPLEPPGTRSLSHGLRVAKNLEFSVEEPMANSSILAFPIMTAPACFNFSTTVALYGGTKLWSIFEEHVVKIPSVHMLSLISTGIPSNGPIFSPRAIFMSTSAAFCRALSLVWVTKDLTFSSTSSILLKTASVISTELISFFASLS